MFRILVAEDDESARLLMCEAHSDLLPKDEQDALTKQRKRNALQMQLNLAVEAEHFEEAAKLRDELRALEQ